MQRSLCLLFVLGCTWATPAVWAEAPAQKAAELDTQVPVKLDYLIYLPSDYEKHDSWPLLLFLHGAGERGNDLELVKKHGPPKMIAEGKSFPMIVVSPQCPKDEWWTSKPLELTALLDQIVSKYKVDKDRVYVSGLSMGGFGTWMLAAYSPERFAAAIPICGGGEILGTRRLTKLPIWAFHGAKDPVVPLKRSEELVDALKKVGAPVKLTVYPDAQHDSWTATYENPDVIKWLLEQKRPASGQAAK